MPTRAAHHGLRVVEGLTSVAVLGQSHSLCRVSEREPFGGGRSGRTLFGTGRAFCMVYLTEQANIMCVWTSKKDNIPFLCPKNSFKKRFAVKMKLQRGSGKRRPWKERKWVV